LILPAGITINSMGFLIFIFGGGHMKKMFSAQQFFLVLLAVGVLLSPVNTWAERTLNPSPELRVLLQQAETGFMKPMGMDLKMGLNKYPDFLASAVGMALHRQQQYANENMNLYDHFTPLREQAQRFLHALAKMHNYKNPTDGSSMSDDVMDNLLMDAVAGSLNNFFFNKFGINPSTINLPLMLTQVPPRGLGASVDTQGKFPQKPKKQGINLLGVSPNDKAQPQPTPNRSCQDCPSNNPGRRSSYMYECGNNIVQHCQYRSQGWLESMYYRLNGELHGRYFDFDMRDGRHFLTKQRNFVNGKEHGQRLVHHITPNGIIYKKYENEYRNGVKVEQRTYRFDNKYNRANLYYEYSLLPDGTQGSQR
jgi:hypothetical protein